MLSDSIRHETSCVSQEDCIGDLAIALGMWIASTTVTEMQAGCFIYSVLKLARNSGVQKEVAIRPFDVPKGLAEKIWTELEEEDGQ